MPARQAFECATAALLTHTSQLNRQLSKGGRAVESRLREGFYYRRVCDSARHVESVVTVRRSAALVKRYERQLLALTIPASRLVKVVRTVTTTSKDVQSCGGMRAGCVKPPVHQI